MADYGDLTSVEESPPTLEEVTDYAPVTLMVAYGDFTSVPQASDAPYLGTITSFAPVGTIDASYHPPTEGQLWPRGDLDAI
jgi:hypothetical protein